MKFNMFEDAELSGLHHGTGADFDVFDPDKIGSGHGNFFGWGFYLVAIQNRADEFAELISQRKRYKIMNDIWAMYLNALDNEHVGDEISFLFTSEVKKSLLFDLHPSLTRKEVLSKFTFENVKKTFGEKYHGFVEALWPSTENKLKDWSDPIRYGIKLVKEGGEFYFLNYSEPPSKRDIKMIVDQYMIDYPQNPIMDEYGNTFKENLTIHVNWAGQPDGSKIIEFLTDFLHMNPKEVSMFLLRAGFDGIFEPEYRYYIVFDPNIIRIVEKQNLQK